LPISHTPDNYSFDALNYEDKRIVEEEVNNNMKELYENQDFNGTATLEYSDGRSVLSVSRIIEEVEVGYELLYADGYDGYFRLKLFPPTRKLTSWEFRIPLLFDWLTSDNSQLTHSSLYFHIDQETSDFSSYTNRI